MFICILWNRKILYIHLWQAHYSTQWSQTTWNDTKETYSHCTTLLKKECYYTYKNDCTIQNKPGKEMVRQNTLVQFPPRKENMPIELHQNINNIYFIPDKLNIVTGAVERDRIHNTDYRLTLNGWPERIQEVPHIAHHFWGTRDELTIDKGVLLKGDRVCIPLELYDRMLSDLHNNHTGMEKIRHLSHTIYWLRIDVAITDYVSWCKICTKHKPKQAVQPMLPTDVPDSPWLDLAADFFTYNRK